MFANLVKRSPYIIDIIGIMIFYISLFHRYLESLYVSS